ncbi:MAG: arginine deiminase family protein [bacterium]
MNTLGVYSEVGRLDLVMVHQPGWEHRRMVPWNREAWLFDDILDIESARPEHKEFVLKIHHHGIRVVYFSDLLKEVCADSEMHAEVVNEVVPDPLPKDMVPTMIQPTHLIMGYPENFTLGEKLILEPAPNLYFMRDPAFFIHDKLIISHPSWPIRCREANLLLAVAKRHPLFKGVEIYDGILHDPEARIEGGDVLIPDEKNVIVGMSERSNEKGAEHLANYLFANTPVERVIKVFIPKRHEYMHLDTLLTFVDRQQIVTMPYFWDKPELYAEIARNVEKLVERHGGVYTGPSPADLAKGTRMECLLRDGSVSRHDRVLEGLADLELIVPEITVTVGGQAHHYRSAEEHILEALREQWNDAANTFALKPGHVMSYARNDKTIRALEDVMVEVTTFSGSELVRGRGGARCMTMPLSRDPA